MWTITKARNHCWGFGASLDTNTTVSEFELIKLRDSCTSTWSPLLSSHAVRVHTASTSIKYVFLLTKYMHTLSDILVIAPIVSSWAVRLESARTCKTVGFGLVSVMRMWGCSKTSSMHGFHGDGRTQLSVELILASISQFQRTRQTIVHNTWVKGYSVSFC